jgi:hypothetical protein
VQQTMDSSFNIPIKLDPPKQSREQQDGQQQQNHPKRPSVMERLKQLEAETSVEAAGLRLPEDHELTEKLSTFLAAQHPEADLQIKVTSHRKTTTTKQQYETVGSKSKKKEEFVRPKFSTSGNARNGWSANGQIAGIAEEINGQNK